MSKAQKIILTIGLLLLALAALFPPRYHIGSQTGTYRAFLYDGTFSAPHSLNLEKLAVEWMFLAAISAFGVVSASNVNKKHSTDRNSEDAGNST